MSNFPYEPKPWWFLLGLPAAGVLVLVVSGCGNLSATNPTASPQTPAGDDAPRVQTVTVKQQDIVRKIVVPGTVEGFETVDLYAKVGGYLKDGFEIDPQTMKPVDIGDRVQKDQLLARLWIPEMEKELDEKKAAVASAEAEVEHAKAALDEAETELLEKQHQHSFRIAEHARIENLVRTGSAYGKLLDEAVYQRNAAQAAVETAKARIQTAEAALKSSTAKVDLAKAERDKVQTLLEYGQIRAPFDGVVTRRLVDRGDFIQSADRTSAATPLLTITKTDVVRIFLDLPMAEVRWLDRGDKAVLDRINVLPGEQFPGQVTRFASALDLSSRMMRVEIDLDNPDHRLLPGYYGYVTLMLDEFPQTPVVPSSALMAEGNETFVYCIEGDVARKRVVTMVYQDGTIVGIGSGLKGGEQIVQAGLGQLADGQQVVAMNLSSGA